MTCLAARIRMFAVGAVLTMSLALPVAAHESGTLEFHTADVMTFQQGRNQTEGPRSSREGLAGATWQFSEGRFRLMLPHVGDVLGRYEVHGNTLAFTGTGQSPRRGPAVEVNGRIAVEDGRPVLRMSYLTSELQGAAGTRAAPVRLTVYQAVALLQRTQ